VGIPLSLFLLAGGAILAFAVDASNDTVNIQAVGWILMAAGLLMLLLSIVLWDTWAGGGFWSGPRRDARAPRRSPPR
jgi:hypothetical protein